MRWLFKIIDGPEIGRELECTGERFLLMGRDLHTQLHFRGEDPYISGVHCLLEILPARCLLRDLESTNGTLVNGKKITHAELQDGDEVQVGKTTLKVEALD